MNVLLISNYNKDIGGISGVVYNTYNKLKEEGFYVEIFNTHRNQIVRTILIFPLLLKVRRFEIIHIHGCSYFGFYPIVLGVIASKIIYKRKTIVTYHGGGAESFFRRNYKLVSIILKKVDHITVMSSFLQNVFSKYGLSTTILPNLTNLESKINFEINLKTLRIISIRTLDKMYNIDDIINAFIIIKEHFEDAELRIIGNGSEIEKLKNYCKERELIGVEFFGKISNERIIEELSKSNIMVSVPSFDNQPLSILEAFASAIPVISSNVGGIPYMIKDGVTGFLVNTNNPAQIAQKILWIMHHPEKTKEIIINASKELTKYQWGSIRKQLLNLYLY